MAPNATEWDADLYIDGDWRRTADELVIKFPYDHSLVGRVPIGGADEVEDAVAAARTAFEESPLPLHRRAALLSAVADGLAERKTTFSSLLVLEVGKTIREARAEVDNAVSALRFLAAASLVVGGETLPTGANSGLENRFAYWIRVPAGPVCAISPFNAPLNNAAHKIGSALAAGNSVVIKPSSSTPLSTALLIRLFHDLGTPAGYVNYLVGDGAVVGEMLLHDPRFARYMFTGSAAIGRRIRETVGLRPTLLELGSNAPTIVHVDADLPKAVDACVRSGFAIAGQVCTSVQRVFAHEAIADDFVRLLSEAANSLAVGDPRDEHTDVGPMLTVEAADRAEAHVRDAVSDGAELSAGGIRVGPTLVRPTVLQHVQPQMTVACSEIFSPIIGVMTYSDLDEAILAANDTPYGLQAGIFTKDLSVALAAARGLRYGGVLVNDASRLRLPQGPYGGVKDSGIGREGGRFAIEELTDIRLVVIDPDD